VMGRGSLDSLGLGIRIVSWRFGEVYLVCFKASHCMTRYIQSFRLWARSSQKQNNACREAVAV